MKIKRLIIGIYCILLLMAACTDNSEEQELLPTCTPSGVQTSTIAPEQGDGTDDTDLTNSPNATDTPDATQGAETTTVPESYKTAIIVLDPGHGGIFSGASYSVTEKDITLQLGLLVKAYLEEQYYGATVYMTRDTDSQLSSDIAEDLELRCEYAKQVKADCLISLHFNASNNHKQSGATVYIPHRKNVTLEADGLAREILDQLTALGLSDNGVLFRYSNDTFDDEGNPVEYYAINRHCANRGIPGIIVEHCFIDHKDDVQFATGTDALEALAKADAEGIAVYFGLMER